MTKRLQQTPPTLGKDGPEMIGRPGHWYFIEKHSGEKTIVESWETPTGWRHGWRIMHNSDVQAIGESKKRIGVQATANAAAKWITKRRDGYAARGVK
jgi:hypothetical protein